MKNKKKILKNCKNLKEAAEKLNITIGEAQYWVKRLGVVLSDDQEKKGRKATIKVNKIEKGTPSIMPSADPEETEEFLEHSEFKGAEAHNFWVDNELADQHCPGVNKNFDSVYPDEEVGDGICSMFLFYQNAKKEYQIDLGENNGSNT